MKRCRTIVERRGFRETEPEISPKQCDRHAIQRCGRMPGQLLGAPSVRPGGAIEDRWPCVGFGEIFHQSVGSRRGKIFLSNSRENRRVTVNQQKPGFVGGEASCNRQTQAIGRAGNYRVARARSCCQSFANVVISWKDSALPAITGHHVLTRWSWLTQAVKKWRAGAIHLEPPHINPPIKMPRHSIG